MIYVDHKKLVGLSEQNGKYRYLKDVRALKTFGVTQFRLKEQVKGKKKASPIILGITRDAVLRLSADTREIVTNYPLTHLKRWAAAPSTFTLDFGDYERDFFTFQTTDGEAISALIAGYIDIILKKRREGAARRKKLDEGEKVATEEAIAPRKAQATSTLSSSMAQGAQSAQISMGQSGQSAMSAMDGATPGMAKTSQMQAGSSVGSQAAAQQAAQMWRQMSSASELQSALKSVESLGTDLEAYSAGSGQRELDQALAMISQASGDLAAAGGAGNAAQMSMASLAAARWKAHSETPEAAKLALTTSAKQVAQATAKLVQGAVKGATADEMLTAAQGVTQATAELCQAAKAVSAQTKGADHKTMISATQELGRATALLCSAAMAQAQAAKSGQSDPKVMQDLVAAARAIGAATTKLVQAATAAFTAPKGDMDESSEALAQSLLVAGKNVTDATGVVIVSAQETSVNMATPEQRKPVSSSALEAAKAVEDFAKALKLTADRVVQGQATPELATQLMGTAKQVGTSSTAVVNATRIGAQQAGILDGTLTQKLAGGARGLAEAINKLGEVARMIVEGDADKSVGKMRVMFEETSASLDAALQQLVTAEGNTQMLLGAAKSVATSSAQLVTQARAAAGDTRDEGYKQRLLAAAQQVGDVTASLVQAVRGAATNPNDPAAQETLQEGAFALGDSVAELCAVANHMELVIASKNYATATTALLASARKAAPAAPQNSAKALIEAAKPAANAMSRLLALAKADDTDPSDLVAGAEAASETGGPLLEAAWNVHSECFDAAAKAEIGKGVEGAQAALDALTAASERVAAGTTISESDLREYYDGARMVSLGISLVLASNTTTFDDAEAKLRQAADLFGDQVIGATARVQDMGLRATLDAASKQLADAIGVLIEVARTSGAGSEESADVGKDAYDATGHLIDAMRAAFPGVGTDLNDESAHQALQTASEAIAASAKCPEAIAEASRQLSASLVNALVSIQAPTNVSTTTSIDIVSLMRTVTADSSVLSQRAGDLGAALGDDMLKAQLLSAAEAVKNATSKLLNSARSNVQDPVGRERFNLAAGDLSAANTEVVVAASIAAGDIAPDDDVQFAAKQVKKSTAQLSRSIEVVDRQSMVTGAKAVVGDSQQLIQAAKTLAGKVNSKELQDRLLAAAKAVMEATGQVIAGARGDISVEEQRNAALNQIVAQNEATDAVCVAASECSDFIRGEEEKAEDPVEAELQNAARALASMTEKLQEVKDLAAENDGTNFSLEERKLNDRIFETATSLAKAATALLKSAQQAQREVVALHAAAPTTGTYLQDSKVKEGLVGGAKSVAGAISLLVEAANEQASGNAVEEKVQAASRGCTAATQQILAASRAKCKTGSASQQKLGQAAKMVTHHAQDLFKVAQESSTSHAPEPSTSAEPLTYAAAQKAEMEQQAMIIRLRKQLEDQEAALKAMRKEKYQGTAGGPTPARAAPAPGGVAAAEPAPAYGYAPPAAAAAPIPAPIAGGSGSISIPAPLSSAANQAQDDDWLKRTDGGGGQLGVEIKCKECDCSSFMPHPFKRKQCKNCFHEH